MAGLDYEFLEGESRVATARRNLDVRCSRAVDRAVGWTLSHWLLLMNLAWGLFATLPFLAPILAHRGSPDLARVIYLIYSHTCHQMPERSWFIFGHQVAYCQRDVAIYTAIFLAGLFYGLLLRGRLRPLGIRWYTLLVLPMVVDGSLQLVGLYESGWLLRTISGALFGMSTVWLTYPYLERAINEMEAFDDMA